MYGPLAHLVEHLTLNQGVRGSSPRRPTEGIDLMTISIGSVLFLSLITLYILYYNH